MGSLGNHLQRRMNKNIGEKMLDRSRTKEFGDRPVPHPGKEPDWVAEHRRLTACFTARPPHNLKFLKQ
jgi:hypothetical protein